MLKDKKKTLSILKEISAGISVPFSLKTRIGLTQDDIQEQFDFLLQASEFVSTI
jgi:tRNA-dihydrouridine synthase